ncbi:MAG: RNA polymerase sigma factor [Rhodospirillales bacterium]
MDPWPLITQLLPDLRAYARTLSDSSQDAEDLVGDAIERTIRSPASPQELSALRAWMFRTIRNLSFDELRKRRVRREFSQALTRLDETGRARGLTVEETALLRRAFERLASREREILFLIDIMGFSYAEAAEILEVPKGTVMSRVSRARQALLALVDPQNSAEPRDRGKRTQR